MGPTGSNGKKYRVLIISCGREMFQEFNDYFEARQTYAHMRRDCATGDQVDICEVDEGGKERAFLVLNDSLYNTPNLADAIVKPSEDLSKHKCQWDGRGKCIKCRKKRMFWG